jgi:hypothetical protein
VEAAAEAVHDQQEQQGADEGDHDLRHHPVAEVPVQDAEQPAAQERADHADHHVDQDAVAAADHRPAGQDAGHQAGDEEDDRVRAPEIDVGKRDGHASGPLHPRETVNRSVTIPGDPR